jgi:hypothetical protein
MSPQRIERVARAIAAAVALGSLLGACSDIYFDRRETLALGAEDAIDANMAEQMVDPWPRYSGNKNIAFNGERMQRAVECYRANKVTAPVDLNPASSVDGAAPVAAAVSCQGKMATGSALPANGSPVASESAK